MAQFNIQAYKAVGGAFSKQALRTSPLILLLALLFVSCEKELFHYAEITEYHAESQQLDVCLNYTEQNFFHFVAAERCCMINRNKINNVTPRPL